MRSAIARAISGVAPASRAPAMTRVGVRTAARRSSQSTLATAWHAAT
jgi:hypothetical protein